MITPRQTGISPRSARSPKGRPAAACRRPTACRSPADDLLGCTCSYFISGLKRRTIKSILERSGYKLPVFCIAIVGFLIAPNRFLTADCADFTDKSELICAIRVIRGSDLVWTAVDAL